MTCVLIDLNRRSSSSIQRRLSSTCEELDPVLRLHLYDTTSVPEVYINQSLVDARLADSWTLKPKNVTTDQDGNLAVIIEFTFWV